MTDRRLARALGEGVALPESLSAKISALFADGCLNEMLYRQQFASADRHNFFDFLVRKLGIESEREAVHALATAVYKKGDSDNESRREVVSALIELVVGEAGKTEGSEFSPRARRYLRSGFNNVLAKLGQPDGEEDDRGSRERRERQEAHRFRQGKFVLANNSDEELSMNILNAAVGDFLPEDVTVEQLYNALHEAAVARVEDDGSSADDRSEPEIRDLRARLGALFSRTRPE